MLGKLDGMVAVITGGASGIGEATVRLFAEEGACCVIADVQDERGEQLATEIGGAAVYQRTDVTSEDAVSGAVRRAVESFGRLDVMFNNAGILGAVGPIQDIPIEEYEHTVNVLQRAVFLGMKHAAPVMKEQQRGCILTTSSVAGITAGDGPHIYNMAKAAIIHLTKSVALELAPHFVRVNAICPGGIVTPLVTGGIPDRKQAEEMARQGLARFQPMPRAGEAIDIARTALWLASDDASFVTGQAIVVDGGSTAGVRWERQPEPFRVHTPMRMQR